MTGTRTVGSMGSMGMGGLQTMDETGEGEPIVNDQDEQIDPELTRDIGRKSQPLGTTGHTPADEQAGIFNAMGAPAIDDIMSGFSAEEMAIALQAIQNKVQQQQMLTAKEGIKLSKTQIDQANQKSMDKIKDWIKASDDAAAKAKKKSIFGWLSIIGAAIACAVAVVATVATGGLASPLLVVAAVGVATLAYSATKMVLEKFGVQGDLSDLFTFVANKVMQILPIPEEKREAIAQIVGCGLVMLATGGATLVVDPTVFSKVVGGSAALVTDNPTVLGWVNMVATATAAVGAAIAMTVLTGGGGAAKAVSGIINAISAVGSAAQNIGSGVMDLEIAKDVKAGDQAKADKKEMDAFLLKLQRLLEEDTEQLKKVLQELEEGFASISQILSDSAASRTQITSNIGRTMA